MTGLPQGLAEIWRNYCTDFRKGTNPFRGCPFSRNLGHPSNASFAVASIADPCAASETHKQEECYENSVGSGQRVQKNDFFGLIKP